MLQKIKRIRLPKQKPFGRLRTWIGRMLARYKGSRQGRFSRISDEGPIALAVRNGKIL
jgi:hypothetical protein